MFYTIDSNRRRGRRREKVGKEKVGREKELVSGDGVRHEKVGKENNSKREKEVGLMGYGRGGEMKVAVEREEG